jgi:hypothetical protein
MRIEHSAGRKPRVTRRAALLAPLVLFGIFGLLFNFAIAAQQQAGNSVKSFKAPLEYFDPPHELQMRSYLEGAESEFLSNGLVRIKEAELHTYHEDGAVEMIVTAPQCIYDTTHKVVSSTGALQVQTWDEGNKKSLHLEGTNGFYWQQTNSFLIVSNRQSTIINGSLTNSFIP